MLIKRLQPAAEVTGLDPDAKALARAQRKADAASASIQIDRGFSDALPYPDASFDRVFSCLMLHHLHDADEKLRTLGEIRRVLRPDGRLHLLDFARPDVHAANRIARLIHASHHLEDNSEARVLSLMADSGLAAPRVLRRGKMMFVIELVYYQASAAA